MSVYLIDWWSERSVEIFGGEKRGKSDLPLMQNRVDTYQYHLSPLNNIASITEPLGGQVSLMVWCPEHA
jgi:hypothetical protein